MKFFVNEADGYRIRLYGIASRNALKERSRIKQEHLEAAIKTNPPSISEKLLKKHFAITETSIKTKL